MTYYAILTMTLRMLVFPISYESGLSTSTISSTRIALYLLILDSLHAYQWLLAMPVRGCLTATAEGCREEAPSVNGVHILEDDPATQEVFLLLLAPDEGFPLPRATE